MKFVTARTGCNVYYTSRSTAILSRESARHHPELLYGIKRNALPHGRNKVVNVFGPIQKYVGARRALTVYRKASGPTPRRISTAGITRNSYQIIWVTSESWQLAHLSSTDYVGQLSGRGINLHATHTDHSYLPGHLRNSQLVLNRHPAPGAYRLNSNGSARNDRAVGVSHFAINLAGLGLPKS